MEGSNSPVWSLWLTSSDTEALAPVSFQLVLARLRSRKQGRQESVREASETTQGEVSLERREIPKQQQEEESKKVKHSVPATTGGVGE